MPTRLSPASTHRVLSSFLAALLGLALSATVQAHQQTMPIAARKVMLKTNKGPLKSKFVFTAIRENAIVLQSDPRTGGAAVWVGTDDPNDGHTGLIVLNTSKWKRLGTSQNLKGYQYKDKDLARGGIRKLTLKDGMLKIAAKGANWPWSPQAPLGMLRVHFLIEQEWMCAEFGGEIAGNDPGKFIARSAPSPGQCPTATCGNGELEPGEECDDGNLDDEDGCSRYCRFSACSGEVFASTFEAIQSRIFESAYGCSTGVCHGSPAFQGGLDLLPGSAHASLVGPLSTISPLTKRVEPGEPVLSVLYDKLRAGNELSSPEFGGSSMPVGTALSDDHLRAVELWIRNGAPQEGVVEGTADLLAGCLPEPDPHLIPVPDPPALGTGVQLQQTPWPLPAQFEDEICLSTFYDFTVTNLVPEWAKIPCPPPFGFAKGCSDEPETSCEDDSECPGATCIPVRNVDNPSNECFVYRKQTLVQDPQSHHSIIRIYTGAFHYDHAGWGPYTFKFQDPNHPLEGQSCNPAAVDPNTGYNANCSGSVQSQVACLGSGPPDLSNGITGLGAVFGEGSTAPQILIGTEPYFVQEYPDGVYNVAPMRGVGVWNSHAFNLTSKSSTMSQYLNLEFADPNDQLYKVTNLFDPSQIFVQAVPPFETREYCTTYTFAQGARLFELGSHTHQRGVLFRMWAPPNTPCVPGEPACVPKDPFDVIYISNDYADPLQLIYAAPIALDSPDPADRSYLYCAVYDNGSTPTSPPVKRRSTSPIPALIFGLPVGPGGPCGLNAVACANEGPKKGQLCNGSDAFCDSFGDAGDGDCDACTLLGGVTTEDEMFAIFAEYFLP